MKGYAQSQKDMPEIDDTYSGWAVYAEEYNINEDFYGNIKVNIVPATYILPFLVVYIFIIAVCVFIYYTPENIMENQPTKILQTTGSQATLVAVILLCMLFTIYTFILDILYVAKDHDQCSHFNYVTTIGVISLIVSLISFSLLLGGSVLCCFDSVKCKCCSLVMCFGAIFLQLTLHIPSILLAWSIDPLYASKIVIHYGILIFSNYVSIKYVYIASYKVIPNNNNSNPNPDDNSNSNPNPDDNSNNDSKRTRDWFCIIIILFFTLLFVNALLVILALFFVSVPVDNSIEESADGLTSIYNGVVVLIGGLIAYNIGWNYFFNSFSLQQAMKVAMKEMKKKNVGLNGNWNNLSEEKRMTEVIKTIIPILINLPNGDNPDSDGNGDNPDSDGNGDNPNGDGDNRNGDNLNGDNPDGHADNPNGDNRDGRADNLNGDNPDDEGNGDNLDGDNPNSYSPPSTDTPSPVDDKQPLLNDGNKIV